MIRDYAVNQRNSTACGYPGRDFDWSKFDWKEETVYDFSPLKWKYSGGSQKGQLMGKVQAPKVFKDNSSFFIAPGNSYLHVPYKWAEEATVFRVRPNESMQAGHVYRGHLVTKCEAVQKEGGWYWRLHSAD